MKPWKQSDIDNFTPKWVAFRASAITRRQGDGTGRPDQAAPFSILVVGRRSEPSWRLTFHGPTSTYA